MSLSILCARTHTAAFDEVCKIVKKQQQQDKLAPVFVVVPDHATLHSENTLIDALGVGGLFSVDVITLNTLARIVLDSDAQSAIGSVGLLAIVKKICIERAGQFVAFKKVAGEVGFAAEIYKTILQLKSSSVSVQDLKNAKEKMPIGLAAKLSDILLIYEDYENFLKGDVFDGPGKFTELIRRLKTCEKVRGAKFVFARFETLTNQVAQIVCELAHVSKGILFATVDGQGVSNEAIFPNIKQVLLNAAGERADIHYSHCKADDVLTDVLYSFCGKRLENNGRFELFEFGSIEDELCHAAEKICDAVKDGIKPQEICVAVADLEKYKSELRRVFDRYGVPINIDARYQAKDSSVARLVLRLCSVFRSDFDAEEVLKLAKCGAFEFEQFDLCEFENYLMARGVSHAMFFDKFLSSEAAERVRSGIIEITGAGYDEFKSGSSVSDYVVAISKVFEKMEEKSDCEKIIKEKIAIVFEELDILLGHEEARYEHFVNILETAISEIKINLVPTHCNAVNVADCFDGFFGHVKLQLIVGASESVYPKTCSDIGVIKDDEIDALKTKFALTPKICDINKKNLFKTFELCFVGEKTVLSYAKVGGERASLIMQNLAQIFGTKIEKAEKELKVYSKKQAELAMWRELKLCMQKLEPHFEQQTRALVDILKPNYELQHRSYKLANFPLKKVSPSQLGTYGTCPFKHFLSYGLHAKKPQEANLQSVDIGNIVHKFCELYTKALSSGSKPDPKELMQRVTKLPKFAAACDHENNRIIVFQLLKEAESIAKKLIRHKEQSEFETTLFEENFDFDLTEKIEMTGKIDRMDVLGSDARIIDYKTGSKKFSLKEVYFGTDFQLATYGAAVNKFGKKFVGAFIMPLRADIGSRYFSAALDGVLLADMVLAQNMDKAFSGGKSELIRGLKLTKEGKFYKTSPVASEKELSAILAYSKAQAELFASEIEEGNIQPSAVFDGESACEFCDFSGAFCSSVCKKRSLGAAIEKGDFAALMGTAGYSADGETSASEDGECDE